MVTRRRCHGRTVPGVISRFTRSFPGRSRISAAITAGSAQSSRGLGLVRRSMATSCRRTGSSAFWEAGERPSGTGQPQSRTKTRQSRRTDTADPHVHGRTLYIAPGREQAEFGTSAGSEPAHAFVSCRGSAGRVTVLHITLETGPRPLCRNGRSGSRETEGREAVMDLHPHRPHRTHVVRHLLERWHRWSPYA